MASVIEQIQKAIVGRSPLVYLVSPEEARIRQILQQLAGQYGDGGLPVHTWSCVEGLDRIGEPEQTRDPASALRAILSSGAKGFFVMQDLTPFLDRPEVIRALRECYFASETEPDRYFFLVASELVVPESLKKEVYVVEVMAPGEEEILAEVDRIQAAYPDSERIPREHYVDVVLALKGLTLAETGHIVHRVVESGMTDKQEVLEEIFTEKEMIVKKTGYLEFTPPRWDISDLGGLDALKDWLTKREKVFTQEAFDAGVPMPKGLLMMGVSGCGKSLAVKVISSLWNVPLFRLDMNLVFSGLYGTAEAAFHNALQTVEAVSPAVLWIDEIENGLGIEEDKITIASHIFSAFLTWMQEKPPLIFVAATANRIHALPAEIIRKGRFDQVFFCDLPTEPEREEIIKIHLRRNAADLEQFDTKMLAILTDGWNGAEIEQAVVSARVDAYYEDRTFIQKDVSRNASTIVPLSTTMEAQIKGIRSWAFSRATPASRYGKARVK